GWPLLMPPGMCICQIVRAGECPPPCSQRPCADDQDDSFADLRCDRETANCCGPCGNRGEPANEECPPGCPANEKTDHSRPLERHEPAGAVGVAATPLPLFLDLSSRQCLHAPAFSSQPSDRPIYLALCPLLL